MKRRLILTTPMMTGDDVVFAQRLLKRHGDYDGELDGEFGILSSQARKDAQSRLGYARPKRAFATPLEKFLSGKAEHPCNLELIELAPSHEFVPELVKERMRSRELYQIQHM